MPQQPSFFLVLLDDEPAILDGALGILRRDGHSPAFGVRQWGMIVNERSLNGDSASHVSLRDVAEQTGVSFQTVSKVLKGEGRVSPATRRRILDAAAELGYVPNTVARSLATRETRSIALVASGLASFVLTPLMQGAEREARLRKYFIVFALTEGDEAQAAQLLLQLQERRVDGVINAAMTLQHSPRYGELLRRLSPCVSLFAIHGGGVPVVGEEATAPGRCAARHLVSLGHRRIANIVGTMGPRGVNERLLGFQEELRAAGIEPDDDLVENGGWTASGGYDAMGRLLDRDSTLTAVFAHNDHMAIGAMRTLHDRGRQVPDDCAVVGCDDIELAQYVTPSLTTVRISFEQNGAAAVRLLLDRIANAAPAPERITHPVELIVRSSCGHGRRCYPENMRA